MSEEAKVYTFSVTEKDLKKELNKLQLDLTVNFSAVICKILRQKLL